ncbi:MAG: heparan-alpha-glucosaminide N-acetyltransferase domain-containing protein [Burkholderiaceae bacterium]
MTASERSRQLDLFRGIAAILMVVNHAGYQLLGKVASHVGPQGGLVFAASAAPALFFFATGVGTGLSGARAEALAGMVRKVLLLLLADAFMNWGGGSLIGFDFFGFAAVSTAVLHGVKRGRRPAAAAAFLLALVLVVRFALAPWLRASIADEPALAFLTGIGFVDGVSYPLCPWLAFPLLGFLMGGAVRQRAPAAPLCEPAGSAPARAPSRERWLAAAVAALGFAAAGAMAARGAIVHRWGSVSLAYFLFAVAVVAAAWLVASWLAAIDAPAARGLMLRGPASLLIVPLHYAALGLLERFSGSDWGVPAWALATALLVIAVLGAARRIVGFFSARASPRGGGAPLQAAALALAAAAGLLAFFLAPPLLRLETACAAEGVVAMVLLLSSRGGPPLKTGWPPTRPSRST